MTTQKELSAAAAIMGAKGGKASSTAKTLAVRKNAKKGGWPKGRKRSAKAGNTTHLDSKPAATD